MRQQNLASLEESPAASEVSSGTATPSPRRSRRLSGVETEELVQAKSAAAAKPQKGQKMAISANSSPPSVSLSDAVATSAAEITENEVEGGIETGTVGLKSCLSTKKNRPFKTLSPSETVTKNGGKSGNPL